MSVLVGLGSLALGAYEYFQGESDKNEAQKKIDELNAKMKDYTIPSAVQEQSNLLKLWSTQGLAGKQQLEGQVKQELSQGVSASREVATSAADLLGATTSLYGQQSKALTNIEIENARQQAQNRQLYAQSLQNLGGWQQQQYYMNEYYPFVSQMNELQASKQSAYDMLVGGISTIASSGMQLASNKTNNPTSLDTTVKTQPNYAEYNYPNYNIFDTSQLFAESNGKQVNLNQTPNNYNWNYPY